MKIRTAAKADIPQIKTLWQYCFGYSDPLLTWNLDKNISVADTIVIDDNGKIVSCAASVPYTLALHGQYIEASYLSGLTTSPEKRRMGLARKILKTAVSEARNQGRLISLLVPSDYTLFQQFGWRTSYFYKQYTISPSDLPAYTMKGDISFLNLSSDSYTKLSCIYNQFTLDKNAYPVRSADRWQIILEDLLVNFGGKAAVLEQDGIPTGYIFYLLHGRTMHIYECAFIHRQAQESLFAFIRGHSTQIDTISMKVPSNDLTHLHFCNQRDAVTLCPFVMARITDAQRALQTVCQFAGQQFRIQIIDRFIPENEGIYTVSMQGVLAAGDIADTAMDIGTFTQLYLGALSVDEAFRLGLISGDAGFVKQLFVKRDNYINMLCL